MKKFYAVLLVLFVASNMFAQSCVIDANNTEFVTPSQDSFPCVERSVAYTESIQLSIPGTFTTPVGDVTIDSVVITSVTGFPTGLNYACNPTTCSFPGGQNGCMNFYGTTSDPAGNYPLTFSGFFYYSPSNPLFPSPVDFAALAAIPGAPSISYALDVIEAGAPCRPDTTPTTGINDFSSSLNAAIYVSPNPNNGQFQLSINAGRAIVGNMMIVDMLGREVYSQTLDVTGQYTQAINTGKLNAGLYTLLIRTAEGSASRKIEIK